MAIFKKQKQKGQKAVNITHEDVTKATEEFFKAGGKITKIKPIDVNLISGWSNMEEFLNIFDDVENCVDTTLWSKV